MEDPNIPEIIKNSRGQCRVLDFPDRADLEKVLNRRTSSEPHRKREKDTRVVVVVVGFNITSKQTFE